MLPQRIDPANWLCEWSVNETNVIYRCSGRVEWKLLASTRNGVKELSFIDFRKAGINAPATIEYSVTKVADLVDMRAWIVVEAGTEALGL